MALFTTEIFIFGTSDAFRNDPKLITNGLNIVLKAAGVREPAYYGTHIENPSTGFIFLDWDKYESHEALMNSPSYKDLTEALTPCLSGTKTMYHVQFSDATIAFEKPVTEFFVLTLKAPEHRATVVEKLTKISESSGKVLVFGQTREDENKYVLVSGSETVENRETVANLDVATALDELKSLTDKDNVFHAKFLKHRL